jgi:hypothetical protein
VDGVPLDQMRFAVNVGRERESDLTRLWSKRSSVHSPGEGLPRNQRSSGQVPSFGLPVRSDPFNSQENDKRFVIRTKWLSLLHLMKLNVLLCLVQLINIIL